jgi:phosphoribosylformylglycinamidine synthase
MGGRGGVGLEIELDLVPQRETGMTPYEIMLSESQERMLLVAERGRESEVFAVFRKWGLDAVTIGRVIAESKMRVLEHGSVVAEIPNEALTDDAPLYNRPLEPWTAPVPKSAPAGIDWSEDYVGSLKALLASSNICSKRWVHEQYDSMVQTNTVIGPGSEAGVIRIKGTNRGLAMALDGNGRWCYLDPKLGAMHAVAESARNIACAGARPVAATNCLNFGNPEKAPIMGQFSAVIDGISEACLKLGTPITGGNVSFYNETLGEGIYPTPVMGVVGIVDDVTKVVGSSFLQVGRTVLLLDGSGPERTAALEAAFGSSEYARVVLGELWGRPPGIDLDGELRLQQLLIHLAAESLIDSAKDISEGGLAVTLAEKCFAKGVGADIDVGSGKLSKILTLFGEMSSQVLVSCDPAHVGGIQQLAKQHEVDVTALGTTIDADLKISIDGAPAISCAVAELKQAWMSALESALHAGSEEIEVHV